MLRTLLLLLLCFVSACSTVSVAPSSEGQEARCHEKIRITGRFSVRYKHENADRAVHGHFEWSQEQGTIQLVLSSPIGQTLASIDISPNKTRLILSDGVVRIAAQPEELLASSLGWAIPVRGMEAWLQGCHRNTRDDVVQAVSDDTPEIRQDGWAVFFYDRVLDEKGMRRPRRIDMNYNAGAERPECALRLIIDRWQPDHE